MTYSWKILKAVIDSVKNDNQNAFSFKLNYSDLKASPERYNK